MRLKVSRAAAVKRAEVDKQKARVRRAFVDRGAEI
jgi:hypothetical protein